MEHEPAIDVHFVPSPNGQKVSIMLEEVGLPYRLIRYNLFEGDQLRPEFLRLNPNGRLPAIVDRDPIGGGAPFAVFESGAILIYLAEKTGRFLSSEPRRRHLALQWLMWQMAGLGPMHGQAHHFVRYCPEENAYGRNRYFNEAKRLMRVLDGRLGEAEYLAEEYSIADMACWPWVRAGRMIGIGVDAYGNVARWYAAIEKREAVKRGAVIPEGSLQHAPAMQKVALTPEQWSNLFGERMLAAAGAAGGSA